MSVFSRAASRVPQATLVLSLSILTLLPHLPSANAAPTPDPLTSSTTPHFDKRADQRTPRTGLSVPALLTIVAVSLFLLLLGSTLAYMYVRRRRVRQKRADHRRRTAQFQEMHRAGARPHYTGNSSSNNSSSASIPASLSFSKEPAPAGGKGEKAGPRYPIKAYVV